MRRYLARRLAMSVPVLLGVATLVFALIHLVPGDPAQVILGETASPRDVAELRATLGLDRPLPAQYVAYLAGLAKGNLGTSLRTNEPVARAIGQRLPATFELALAAIALALLVAIPLGVLAASRAGTWIDRLATGVALAGISMPTFWLGPLLAIVFGIVLGWLPIAGNGTVAHLVLPALTLAVPLAAVLSRMTRASVIEEVREPYVRAARARGISRSRALWIHALRNSLLPLVSMLGLQMGSLLTGAVITETVFAWPGVGRLLIQSIAFRDYPIVQGCILLIALTYVATNLLTDVVYGLVDPRIRYE